MPTFDIVSEVNTVELRHAVENSVREVGTRFDFNGIEASISLDDLTVTLRSESDFQVKQLEAIFRNHCAKRHVSTVGVTMEDKPVHSGKFFTLTMKFKQGIEQPDAKDIIKHIKDSKLKVQTAIQGDKIRVTGKKRDDLQEVIAYLRKLELKIELQFNNFRD